MKIQTDMSENNLHPEISQRSVTNEDFAIDYARYQRRRPNALAQDNALTHLPTAFSVTAIWEKLVSKLLSPTRGF